MINDKSQNSQSKYIFRLVCSQNYILGAEYSPKLLIKHRQTNFLIFVMPSSSRKRQQPKPTQNIQKEQQYSPSMSAYHSHVNQQVMQIRVQKQTILKMIQSFQQENTQLQKSKSDVREQLKSLNSMSEIIVTQNRQMRELYFNRNSDIQKLMKTMQIQTGQEYSDHEHQIALSKQGNNLLVKQIEIMHQLISDKRQIIQALEEQKSQIDQDALLVLQEKLLQCNARIQSYFSPTKIQELERALQKLTEQVFNLTEEVQNLEQITSNISGKNRKQLQSCMRSLSENEKDSDIYKKNIVFNLKSIKQISKENEQLKIDYSEQVQTNQNLSKRLSEVKVKLTESRTVNIKLDISEQASTQEVEQLSEAIRRLRGSKNQKQIQKFEMIEHKDAILVAIQQRKVRLRQLKTKQENHLENNYKEHSSQVLKIDKQIYQKHSDAQRQMKRFALENQRLDPLIEASQQQFEQIEKDVSDYNIMVKGLDNPASQIQRTQMLLKMTDSRRPLGQLFG